jgi:hypothetical protein
MTVGSRHRFTATNLVAAAIFTTALSGGLLAGAGSGVADAATKSCLRPAVGGGAAKLEAAAGSTIVVRVKAKRTKGQTRHENLLACWRKTGKRVTIAEEVDHGLDNIARTDIEIVQGRYAGVLEENEGGVSVSRQARIYDVRGRKLLHDSKQCDIVDRGDLHGVDDAMFLDNGGMAMSCGRLLMFRKAGSALETLEPAGTDVRQLGASHGTAGFGQRVFWTIVTAQGEVTKSLEP